MGPRGRRFSGEIIDLGGAVVIDMECVAFGASSDLLFAGGRRYCRHCNAAAKDSRVMCGGPLGGGFAGLMGMAGEAIRDPLVLVILGTGRTLHQDVAFDTVGTEMALRMLEDRFHELKAFRIDVVDQRRLRRVGA